MAIFTVGARKIGNAIGELCYLNQGIGIMYLKKARLLNLAPNALKERSRVANALLLIKCIEIDERRAELLECTRKGYAVAQSDRPKVV